MLVLPSLFLYVDFFIPLFFLVMMVFIIFFCVKFLLKECVYKFLCDLFAKDVIYFLKRYKFFDLFLNNINSKGATFFSFQGFWSNNYMRGLNFNSVVIVLILVFFLIWGCILSYKICVLRTQDCGSSQYLVYV